MTGTLTRHWYKRGSGPVPDHIGDINYLMEIELQCEFALRSFGQMNEIFATDPKHLSLLALAHMLLVFGGNVAKLLTCSKNSAQKTKNRTARLCKTLGFNAEDFSTIRRARNHFEHFDERMDKSFGCEGLVIPRMIEDHEPTSITLDDGRTFMPIFMRMLNTSTLELILYGERFSLQEVLQLLQSVQASAKTALNKQGVPGYEAAKNNNQKKDYED